MARVTIEDCLDRIPSHFDLCLVASKRARQLARGASAHLPWEDHKSTVLALKEVATGMVGMSALKEDDLPELRTAASTLDFPELGSDI